MLELMRKHAGSWMIKILLGALAMAFALSFGVYSYYGRSKEVALKVNDEPITLTQLRDEQGRLSEEMRRQLGKQFDQMAPLLNIKQRAVDSLVNRVLLFQAANQMGVVVSDVEVAQKVSAVKAFQRNGRFDMRTYERVLARNRLNPESFEANLRGQILMEKLSIMVAGAAQVTPLEVDDAMKAALAKVRGVYKIFPLEGRFEKQTANDAEIKAYYQGHQNEFRVPEKLVLEYAVFPVARYRDQADVREDDVRDAYEMSRNRYAKPEKVKASHILIKLPENPAPAEVAAAKKKAEEVLALAKKKGADFAALAKKYSQGPTAASGGDLGSFKRGAMVPAFDKLAFSLKPGQLGLVRTRFGWHVVKVFKHQMAQVTPFKEVEGEIRQKLVERRAKDLAEAAAERAFEEVAAGKAFKDLAARQKLSLNTTEPFVAGQPPKDLPGLKGLAQAQEGLPAGQPVPPLTFDGGALLAVIKTRVPARTKTLDEVREDVAVQVREQKARKAAEAEAQALVDKLQKEKDPAAALKAMAGAKTTGWLSADGDVEDLNGSANLVAALFLRPQKSPVVPKALPLGEDYGAAVLAGRELPDKEQMAEKRKAFAAQLLASKRRTALKLFLDDLRARAQIQVVAKL